MRFNFRGITLSRNAASVRASHREATETCRPRSSSSTRTRPAASRCSSLPTIFINGPSTMRTAWPILNVGVQSITPPASALARNSSTIPCGSGAGVSPCGHSARSSDSASKRLGNPAAPGEQSHCSRRAVESARPTSTRQQLRRRWLFGDHLSGAA